jgi:hypothetical protein
MSAKAAPVGSGSRRWTATDVIATGIGMLIAAAAILGFSIVAGVIAGPCCFLFFLVYCVVKVGRRSSEGRRLQAPVVTCADAESHIGRRVALVGRVSTETPILDPISGEDVVYFSVEVDGVERDRGGERFRIEDATGRVAVSPEEMRWDAPVSGTARQELEHGGAAYRAAPGAREGASVLCRRVPVGSEIVVIGEVGWEDVIDPAGGYRGSVRQELRIFSRGDGMILGTRYVESARAVLGDRRDIYFELLLYFVASLVLTALGTLPFLLHWFGF